MNKLLLFFTKNVEEFIRAAIELECMPLFCHWYINNLPYILNLWHFNGFLNLLCGNLPLHYRILKNDVFLSSWPLPLYSPCDNLSLFNFHFLDVALCHADHQNPCGFAHLCHFFFNLKTQYHNHLLMPVAIRPLQLVMHRRVSSMT